MLEIKVNIPSSLVSLKLHTLLFAQDSMNTQYTLTAHVRVSSNLLCVLDRHMYAATSGC